MTDQKPYTPRVGDLLVHTDGDKFIVGGWNNTLPWAVQRTFDAPWQYAIDCEIGVLRKGWRLERNVLDE